MEYYKYYISTNTILTDTQQTVPYTRLVGAFFGKWKIIKCCKNWQKFGEIASSLGGLGVEEVSSKFWAMLRFYLLFSLGLL